MGMGQDSTQGEDQMKSDLEKIQELDRKDIEASKSQDYPALLALWDEGGVAIPPGGDPIVGIRQIEAWLDNEAKIEYQVTRYEHTFQERKILGEWAFEWGSYRSAAVIKESGQTEAASGKLLRILKRQPDGEWKVARSIWNLDPGS